MSNGHVDGHNGRPMDTTEFSVFVGCVHFGKWTQWTSNGHVQCVHLSGHTHKTSSCGICPLLWNRPLCTIGCPLCTLCPSTQMDTMDVHCIHLPKWTQPTNTENSIVSIGRPSTCPLDMSNGHMELRPLYTIHKPTCTFADLLGKLSSETSQIASYGSYIPYIILLIISGIKCKIYLFEPSSTSVCIHTRDSTFRESGVLNFRTAFSFSERRSLF
jgi:hypothetical protein